MDTDIDSIERTYERGAKVTFVGRVGPLAFFYRAAVKDFGDSRIHTSEIDVWKVGIGHRAPIATLTAPEARAVSALLHPGKDGV